MKRYRVGKNVFKYSDTDAKALGLTDKDLVDNKAVQAPVDEQKQPVATDEPEQEAPVDEPKQKPAEAKNKARRTRQA